MDPTGSPLRMLLGGSWPPLVVFLLHLFFSRVVGWYRDWPALDIPVHIAGGMAIAHFFQRLVLPATTRLVMLRPWAGAVFVLSLTCTAAVWWEFAEYLSDRYMGTHAQGGLNDTLGDMFMGVAGGVLCVLPV